VAVPFPDLLLVLVVVFGEFLPGLVVVALDVEGNGEVVEDVLVLSLVESLHIIIEGLLIPQEFVVLEVVVDLGLHYILKSIVDFTSQLLCFALAL
jgi:hypothetical protein